MIVVGVSALYHDAAVAVIVDGRLVAAAHEERFTRRRFDPAMPALALRACLRQAGLSIADIDCIAYYEDPTARLSRQLWAALPDIPPATPEALFRLSANRPFREIRDLLAYDGPVVTVTHHEAHAASAFYFSGFSESALLTADAVGEWTTTGYGRAGEEGIELLEEVAFPHSLGLLYSTITSYLGFAVNSDEYKVMGLAPYGRPRRVDALRTLVTDLPGGQFRLTDRYFDFQRGERMYTDALSDLLGCPPRRPGDPIDSRHEDIAHSLQSLIEEILLKKVRYLHEMTGSQNLCYAGGVALNCVANARLRREGPFEEIFIPPAAGDAGGSVGAAAIAHHRLTGTFQRHRMADARLGPAFDVDQVRMGLDLAKVEYDDYSSDQEAMVQSVARMLAAGRVVGWCQGRMEFGPRALGGRSILADPRREGMRDHINALVKQRETFRPFAPAVVAERAGEFFDTTYASPFMLDTAKVRNPSTLPAITHVDGSARLQTVEAEVDPLFHRLLTAFGELTGFPILLNTSFNQRGEPIVCDPADALAAFVRCRLDLLAIGTLVIRREQVPEAWHDAVSALAAVEQAAIERDVYTFI